ncbi:MAG TPA: Nudix family hydrolase [Moraxellaceae bacterium]
MKRILVAAAVIRRDGHILIAQRPLDKHQGGLWEFPGGKVEDGEPVQDALCRELDEELGMQVTASRPLIRITHDYPDKSVCLDVWEVNAFTGEPHGREGQPVRWVKPGELAEYTFPAANLPILAAARLPAQYHISPEDRDETGLLSWLDEVSAKNASLLLLRLPAWPRQRYVDFARRFLARCRESDITLLLHGDADLLDDVPAGGLHLPANALKAYAQRPLPSAQWLAASVHNAQELAQAEALGVDFVTLSPVQATLSHPGATTLGWEGFSALSEKACVPVFALGGMKAADVELAWQHGGQGVAGIRGL